MRMQNYYVFLIHPNFPSKNRWLYHFFPPFCTALTRAGSTCIHTRRGEDIPNLSALISSQSWRLLSLSVTPMKAQRYRLRWLLGFLLIVVFRRSPLRFQPFDNHTVRQSDETASVGHVRPGLNGDTYLIFQNLFCHSFLFAYLCNQFRAIAFRVSWWHSWTNRNRENMMP